jgi:hypothetical protein
MLDFFGKSNPRKMPKHLFSAALHLDYATAVKADISKQNFSVCPRHWYVDATYRCARCGNTFVFTADEQRFWYEERKFWIDSWAKRCKPCREAIRELKSLKQEYDRELGHALASNATAEQKQRLITVIEALAGARVDLPAAMQEHFRILTDQIRKLS